MARRGAARAFWTGLALASFALHLGWEYAQCELFFVHGRAEGAAAMLRAALGDLVLTGIAYLGTALVVRNIDWPLRAWTLRVWIALLGLALALGVGVELHALAMGWWSYTARAPLLPGTPVSIVPLLQLLVLFPASFGIARAVALRWLRCAAA